MKAFMKTFLKTDIGRLTAMQSVALLLLAACGNPGDDGVLGGSAEEPGRRVETTGKELTELDAVPDAVLDAVRKARPELQIATSEHEVRDGNEYYDVAGTMPDGSELELDLTRADGVWTVVEVQRDLSMEQVPEGVHEALTSAKADWSPIRIIESDQGGGLVIYEFFGPGPGGEEMKVEVKWQNNVAEVLSDEWVH